MRIIEFDGHGRAKAPDIGPGAVLLLVQGAAVHVVRLEALAGDDFGPCLTTAIDDDDLAQAATRAVRDARPECFTEERDFVLECPREIATRAVFED